VFLEYNISYYIYKTILMIPLSSFFPTSLWAQLLFTFLSFTFAGVLYLIYKLIGHPLIRMQYYRKQGIPCYFFPLVGYIKNFITGLQEHGDFLYHSKLGARTNPSRVLCTNIGPDATLFLRDPALVKEFYLNTDNYIKDPLYLELFSPVLGKGLTTSEGNHWKGQRKVMSNVFHFEFMKSILPSIQATARKNLSDLKKTSLSKVHAMDELQKTTGEVVGKVFFGEQLNDYTFDGKPLTLGLADLIVDISKINQEPIRYILGGGFILKGVLARHRKVVERMNTFRSICSQIVQSRKNSHPAAKSEDLLHILLNYEGSEGKMSDEEIVDQFVAMFLAGMDTTGHLLTMVVYYLDKYPKFKERMIQEMKQNYPLDRVPTVEDLNKLEFTMAFLKETLRVNTPVIGVFPRKAVRDHQLKDIHVKKGDVINLEYHYNHHNPAYFDNVDDFEPERWLDKSKTVESYAFTPFSAGARNCIGQHLALNEARIILGELLNMYDFKLQSGYQLKMASPFLYEPLDPILLDLTPREK